MQAQHVCTQGNWERAGKEGGQYGVLKVQAGPNHQHHMRMPAVMKHGHLNGATQFSEAQLWHAGMLGTQRVCA